MRFAEDVLGALERLALSGAAPGGDAEAVDEIWAAGGRYSRTGRWNHWSSRDDDGQTGVSLHARPGRGGRTVLEASGRRAAEDAAAAEDVYGQIEPKSRGPACVSTIYDEEEEIAEKLAQRPEPQYFYYERGWGRGWGSGSGSGSSDSMMAGKLVARGAGLKSLISKHWLDEYFGRHGDAGLSGRDGGKLRVWWAGEPEELDAEKMTAEDWKDARRRAERRGAPAPAAWDASEVLARGNLDRDALRAEMGFGARAPGALRSVEAEVEPLSTGRERARRDRLSGPGPGPGTAARAAFPGGLERTKTRRSRR